MSSVFRMNSSVLQVHNDGDVSEWEVVCVNFFISCYREDLNIYFAKIFEVKKKNVISQA